MEKWSKLIESLHVANRWFLIRQDGKEIELNYKNGIVMIGKYKVAKCRGIRESELELIKKTIKQLNYGYYRKIKSN